MKYTTIKKVLNKYDVLITDDHKELPQYNDVAGLKKKNLLRVYCEHGGNYYTFVISVKLLNHVDKADEYINRQLDRNFTKLKLQQL